MTINGDAYSASLQAIDTSSNFETQKGVSLLKKANDQIVQQGQALIEMIDSVPTGDRSPGFDTYA